MNETIYDTGTIAWALQRAREASEIPRYREKIDPLKKLLIFINDWCKRGQFDQEQIDYCNEKFTKLFNEKSLQVGKEKAYGELVRIFLNFYDNLGYFEYPTKFIMSYLISMAKRDIRKIDEGVLLQELIKQDLPSLNSYLDKIFKDGEE